MKKASRDKRVKRRLTKKLIGLEIDLLSSKNIPIVEWANEMNKFISEKLSEIVGIPKERLNSEVNVIISFDPCIPPTQYPEQLNLIGTQLAVS